MALLHHGVRVLLPLAAIASALSGCDPAEAEEPEPPRRADEFRSDNVTEALDRAGTILQTRGLSPEGDPWRGFLVDQGSEVTEVSLSAGSCYVVVAAGSTSLRELDLRLFDGDGTEVAQDGQVGPGTALRYCPPHSGTHYVAALATAGTGLFGVRRYQGPTGLEVRTDDLFRSAGAEQPAPERP